MMRILMLGTATAADLDAIYRMEQESFTDSSWSRDSWQAELDGPNRYVAVAKSQGEVVGCATFSCVGDTAELLRVIVEGKSRGQRIGEELVLQGISWAGERGAIRMMLEVSDSNDAALKLYRRLGFVSISSRADYYGTGKNAIVMERGI